MKRKAILLLALMLIFVLELTLPAAYLSGPTGDMPMVSLNLNVTIENQIATTKLEMSFYNNNSYSVQPNFRFPLNERASVQSLTLVDSNGNLFEAKIGETAAAKATFDNALKESAMPAMATQHKPGVFETTIGTVPPTSNASIILEYCEVLPYQSGIITYVYPLAMNEFRQSRNVDAISASINVKDKKQITSIDTKQFAFPVHLEKINDHERVVFFEMANNKPTNDFILSYEVTADEMGVNLVTNKPNPDEAGYFLMTISPQEVFDATQIVKRDIVFVVDVSGSMAGKKLAQTKEAFEFFVNKLNSDDRFNIIAFDGRMFPFKNGLIPFTPANKEQSVAFIKRLRAGSTTNINQALIDALKNFEPAEDRTKAIIFLTDGEPCGGVTSLEGITGNVRAHNKYGARLFCIGVGRYLNTTLLNKLAHENRGETLYVDENRSNIHDELSVFYTKISTPLLVDPEIHWQGIEITEMYPKQLPNLYHGQQIALAGRFNKIYRPELTLKGKVNGVDKVFPVEANFNQASDRNAFVSKNWAQLKANFLQREIDALGHNEAKKQEIIELSKKYQFLTKYTSFVAVSDTPVKQVAKPISTNLRTASSQPGSKFQPQSQPQAIPQPQPKNVRVPSLQPSAASAPAAKTLPPVVKKTHAKPIELWGANGFIPFAALAVPNFKKAREQARPKACASNMRVLMGAVEMYNMDNGVMMRVLDQELLREGGYLKALVQCPEQVGTYGSVGDLSDENGRVACTIHGVIGVENTKDYKGQPIDFADGTTAELNPNFYFDSSSNYGTYVRNNPDPYAVDENTPWAVRIWNQHLAKAVNLLINVPLFFLGLYCFFKVTYYLGALISVPFDLLFKLFKA
jgi:uncharacterized protein YegL/competence protein ComGC